MKLVELSVMLGFLLGLSPQLKAQGSDAISVEMNEDFLLNLTFPPLPPEYVNPAYEVICGFVDPNTFGSFPYVNNFIKVDLEKSTPSLYVGSVSLKGLVEPFRGAEMHCSLQYRVYRGNQLLGGEIGSVPTLMIPSVPKIVQPLTKSGFGVYSLIFRYEFPEDSTQNFFSLKCQNAKQTVQYNFEAESKSLDIFQVKLNLKDWATPNSKDNIRYCHLIARYNYRGGYDSRILGYVGKIAIFYKTSPAQ